MNTVTWRWLGLRPIEEMLAIQRELFEQKMRGSPSNVILFAEHPPCITYAHPEELKYLRVAPEILRKKGIPLIEVPGRGGKITFHGPGQLVCYLTVGIGELCLFYDAPDPSNPERKTKRPDVTRLVSVLDLTVAKTIGHYGLTSTTKPNDPRFQKDQGVRGVWIEGKRKIASRGLKVAFSGPNLIATFGFALNISTDLSGFSLIYPCGYDIEMTSMERELNRTIDTREILFLLVRHFQEILAIPFQFEPEKN